MQFIMVASIPIWSALVRSIFSEERPLQKLPPPITIPTSVPASTNCLTCSATPLTVSSSKPVFLSPASASPLNFSMILFIKVPQFSYLFISVYHKTQQGKRVKKHFYVKFIFYANCFNNCSIVCPKSGCFSYGAISAIGFNTNSRLCMSLCGIIKSGVSITTSSYKRMSKSNVLGPQ